MAMPIGNIGHLAYHSINGIVNFLLFIQKRVTHLFMWHVHAFLFITNLAQFLVVMFPMLWPHFSSNSLLKGS